MTPDLRFHPGLSFTGFHHLAYWHWGPERAARTVVCVHGVTRQGRDFDTLARALVERGCRVVCPDLAGRGQSGWLAGAEGYTLLQYGADMNALLARLDVERVDWVGTSLGGLIGMILAGQPGSPIQRLVINDIGPFIPGAALRRLGTYLNAPPPRFDDLDEAVGYFRTILAPYGELTDRQWRHIAEPSIRPGPDGGFELRYDPAIGETYRPWRLGSLRLWEQWEQIECPTLVLRGEESDLLLRSTAEEMTQSGPHAALIEFPGVGHVVPLVTRDQIEPILAFLDLG